MRKYLTLTIVFGVFITTALADSALPKKSVIVKEILSLPPNLIYEENSISFQKRIHDGKFWIDRDHQTLYLFINGDGSSGERLFILHQSLDLYIVELSNDELSTKDEGEIDCSLYKYDRSKQSLFLIGSFKNSLFKHSNINTPTLTIDHMQTCINHARGT